MTLTHGQQQRPSNNLQIWWTAARPHTLTASLCPCLIAYASNRPPLALQLAWTLFCITIQLGTNLHNDYADFVRGADTDKRVGHARATARGWWTPQQTCAAATASLSASLVFGIYLIAVTRQWNNWIVWFVILSSIFNAFAYTAGPFPLGYIGLENCSIAYAGLGDLFVMLYFGLVATWMLPYLLFLQGAMIDWTSQLIYGLQVGLLAVNIIVVNNLRDVETDIVAHKMTTAVRFGKRFARMEYACCLFFTYSLVLWHAMSLLDLLPLLSLPFAVTETRAVWRTDGAALNSHVGGAAKVQTAFCLLLTISLLLT